MENAPTAVAKVNISMKLKINANTAKRDAWTALLVNLVIFVSQIYY